VFFYRYHVSLTRLHRYHAPPWLWFSPLRGVVYYSQASDAGYRIVAGIGNPFALWFSLLAISYLAVSVVARGRSTTSADAFIVAGFLATYGPWFLLSGDRLPFAFYLLPSIPFMELALASVVVAVARRPVVRVLVPLWATFTLGFFISVYPWYTAIREPDWWWVHLSPRAFDCDWLRFTVPAPSATHLRC
ncbi:MAG: hypothetical protein QN178_14535, partial [Armatimonadota bacterium]|nr:hypothetical protein [Armatimonadota bacterium]